MQILDTAKELLNKIERLGYVAYIVGGAVRDLMLKEEETGDVDIATDCPIKVLEKNFVTREIGNSKDFGVIGVYYQARFFEVAHFRTDGIYEDHRKPSSVAITGSLMEDVKRRDFTINALAMSCEGAIYDYVGGLEDLEKGVIRAVGNPDDRFFEDPVRMVRAARFAARFDFSISPETTRSIRHFFRAIQMVTKERLRLEIVKAATYSSESFARFIEILSELKLLAQILPEVDALRYLNHNREHHPEGKTVFEHTMAAVRAVEMEEPETAVCRLATLFHDLGKATCFTEKEGLPKYYGHASEGIGIVEGLCDRLTFPNHLKERLVYVVKNHMLFADADEMKPAKVARLISSDHFDLLVEVCRADDKSRGDAYYSREKFDAYVASLLEIKEKWNKFLSKKPLQLISGDRIMYITGLEPGKTVGEIKKRVEDRIINEGISPEDSEKIYSLVREEHECISKES